MNFFLRRGVNSSKIKKIAESFPWISYWKTGGGGEEDSCETPPIRNKNSSNIAMEPQDSLVCLDCWASRIGGPRSMSICDSGGLNTSPSFSSIRVHKTSSSSSPIVSTNEFRWSHYCDWIGAASQPPFCLNGESPQAIRTKNAHENTFFFFKSNLPPSADGHTKKKILDRRMCVLL